MLPFPGNKKTGSSAQAAPTSHTRVPRKRQEQQQQPDLQATSSGSIARPNKRAAAAAASTMEKPPPAKRVRVAASPSSRTRTTVAMGPITEGQGANSGKFEETVLSFDVSKGDDEAKWKRVMIEHVPSTGATTEPSNVSTAHPQPPLFQQNRLPIQETNPRIRIKTREPFSHHSTRETEQQQQQQPFLSLAHYMGYEQNINLARHAQQLFDRGSDGEPVMSTPPSGATDLKIIRSDQAHTQAPVAVNATNDDNGLTLDAMDMDADGGLEGDELDQDQSGAQGRTVEVVQRASATMATLKAHLRDATTAAAAIAPNNKGTLYRPHPPSSFAADASRLADPFGPPAPLRTSQSKKSKHKRKKNPRTEKKLGVVKNLPRLTKSGVPYRRRRTQLELVMEAAIWAGFVEQVPNRSLVTGEPLVEEPLERFEKYGGKNGKGGKDVWDEEAERARGGKSIGGLLREIKIMAREAGGGGGGRRRRRRGEDGEDDGSAWDGDDEDEAL